MSDRGESLYVVAEQPSKGCCFRLAELRVLLGDVRNRAVVLAHLDTCRRRFGTGGVAKVAQCSREGLRLVDVASTLPLITEILAQLLFKGSGT